MNRYIQFLYLLIFSTGGCIAQVGIKTTNPIEIFNIDVKGNNPQLNPEKSNTLKDDLIFRLNINNEANLVIGGNKLSDINAASLELNDPNKALLLNKIPLKSAFDTSTVSAPSDGMIIYNTTIGDDAENKITPGIYLNMNKEWVRLADKESEGIGASSKIKNLSQDTQSGLLSNTSTGAGATKLNVSGGDIEITEDGRYYFTFRLYGAMSSGLQYGNYFLYLFKKDNSGIEELMAKVEIVVVKISNSTYATYSPSMSTTYLKEGDTVIIKIGHQSTPSWTLKASNQSVANRTSFAYWKIE